MISGRNISKMGDSIEIIILYEKFYVVIKLYISGKIIMVTSVRFGLEI